MKLIVQIPALDEADTLPSVLRGIPRSIPGVDVVEVLVVDDGSKDGTAAIAAANGADHVVRHLKRKGLPVAFQTGIDTALRAGADIIVNMDGDGQYSGEDIPRLIAPIVNQKADIVVGDRQTSNLEHFTGHKTRLQRVGSAVVRWASETEVPDTVSGFRALNREAALRLFVTTDFSYTVENLIQAGKRRLTVTHVPISARPTRPSRLHRGNWHFVKRQASTIVRTYATYEPLKTFSYLAAPWVIAGTLLLLRATYVYFGRKIFPDFEADNTQALIAGVGFLMLGFLLFAIGLVSDRIGGNRRLLEEILYRQRRGDLEDIAWRNVVEARVRKLEDPLLPPTSGVDGESDVRERVR
jgi:glycosyltransferase involved in cell wall biosynthesis